MASEVTVYSKDGNWKIEVEAWKNHFLIYKSIGTEVNVYHKEPDTNVWGNATTSWNKKNAIRITIENTYKGPVFGGGSGSVTEAVSWDNTDDAALKHSGWGFLVDLGSGDVSGGAILDIDSVDGVVDVVLETETLTAKVSASSIISDGGIW